MAAMEILYRLSGFRGDFLEIDQPEKQELPMAAMFVNGSERNEQS